MTKLFILIKIKGNKSFLGAIPAKKGASMLKLRKTLRKQLKPGFSARIVNEAQLKRVIVSQRPRRSLKRVGKRKIVNKSVRRRVKRRIKRSVKRKVKRRKPVRRTRKRVVRRKRKRR